MNSTDRHGVKVTVSPLLTTGEQRRAAVNSVTPYLRGEQRVGVLSDRTLALTQPADITAAQATGILPRYAGITEQIYVRGIATDTVATRPTKHRASRRRMKIASRIAYRRATVKRTPAWLPWICVILGLIVLVGVFYWFGTAYLENIQHSNSC